MEVPQLSPSSRRHRRVNSYHRGHSRHVRAQARQIKDVRREKVKPVDQAVLSGGQALVIVDEPSPVRSISMSLR